MIGELTGLVAVLFIFGPAVIIPVTAMVLKHRKDMARMELERRAVANQELIAQIEALRRELAELRRTSTEYDMSLQENLENLQERVRALETTRENQSAIRLP